MSLRGRLTDLWGFEDESNPSKDRPFRDLWRFWSCNDVCPTCGIYEQSSHQYINFSSDPSVEPLRYWTKLRCIEARFENMAIFFVLLWSQNKLPWLRKHVARGVARNRWTVDLPPQWLASTFSYGMGPTSDISTRVRDISFTLPIAYMPTFSPWPAGSPGALSDPSSMARWASINY